MTDAAIKARFKNVGNRFDLLCLLNDIKAEEFGPDYPFTIDQLNHFCNSAGNARHYHVFRIPKKSGGTRTIYAPSGMLKNLLRCTNILLQGISHPSDAAMGFRSGRSVVDNASAHCNRLYVFNSDLKDFFPSISKNRVRAALKCVHGMDEKIADALANLCCVRDADSGKDFLPQGSPASPCLTNIVCGQLDAHLCALARRFGCTYTRYADDMTFSSNRSLYSPTGNFMREFRLIVSKNGFEINERKTRCQKTGSRQEVTGLVVGQKVNVSKKYVHDLRCILHIWERHGVSDAVSKYVTAHPDEGRGRLKTSSFKAAIRGKLNYLRMVKGEDDSTFVKLWERFEKLCQAEKKKRSGSIELISVSKIPHFEKIHGCTVTFNDRDVQEDLSGSKDYGFVPFTVSFCVNGITHRAYMSRNCCNQLKAKGLALTADSLNGFRNRLCICLFADNRFGASNPFWVITWKYPKGSIRKEQDTAGSGKTRRK